MINVSPDINDLALFLAQVAPAGADGPAVDGAAGGQGAPTSGGLGGTAFLLPLMLLALLFILMPMGTRREKKRRAALIASLAKHDRVRTSGGIIGTIMEIKGNEVTLKVDEATNTRITFDKGAVESVIKHARSADAEPDSVEEEQEPELVNS